MPCVWHQADAHPRPEGGDSKCEQSNGGSIIDYRRTPYESPVTATLVKLKNLGRFLSTDLACSCTKQPWYIVPVPQMYLLESPVPPLVRNVRRVARHPG